MIQHHNWSLTELDNMLPYERQIYVTLLQQWIREGALTLDGVIVKPRTLIKGRETINVLAEQRNIISELPEDIPLEIIWEDRDLIIINKPAGLVVHPGAGNRKGTLLNGLLNYDKRLALIPRGGIVHRLDKNTSGLMIVAKNELTYQDQIAKYEKLYPEKFNYIKTVTREKIDGCLNIRIPVAIENKEFEKISGISITKDSQFMACGNPGMINDTVELLGKSGLERNRRSKPGNITLEKYW